MSRLTRLSQTVTAGAALFAILGACGLTPLSRGPRVRPRPRPPGTEITVRSLTGYWVAVRDTTGGRQVLTLSLVESGNTVAGTLRVGDRILASDPAQAAHLGSGGQFTLGLGQSHERVVVQGHPDASGDRLLVTIRGLDPALVAVAFTRS